MNEEQRVQLALQVLMHLSGRPDRGITANESTLLAVAISCLESAIREPHPALALDSIGLTLSVVRPLARNGILTTADVCKRNCEQLLAIPGFGVTALNKLRKSLAVHGVRLRDD